MPFTPAHPAIVLPLLKSRYFSATGLIVGSVSPDFEYFFKASVSGVHGHTLAGIFYFDLPVSIFLALTFHLLVKGSLIGNLPTFLQSRLQPLSELNFKSYLSTHFLVFLFSALIGAVSHIFWDSFTHNGRYFVNTIPILRTTYIPFDGAKYPLWYALQHFSTLFGLSIILIYTLRMESRPEQPVYQPKISYWIAIIMLGCILFYLRFELFTVRFEIGNIVVSSMSSLMLAMCLVSTIRFFKASSIIRVDG
jgi:Domain of unknown function (DUF4184)